MALIWAGVLKKMNSYYWPVIFPVGLIESVNIRNYITGYSL